ncbi:MAG: hypothetical protein II551_06400 [Paludibacteraceae bacterium]|nr:hypothetical protein [Paludibacteraceae bacterium]
MKKLFLFLLTCLMTAAVYAQSGSLADRLSASSSDAPKEIRDLLPGLRREFADFNEEGMSFQDVKIEGQNMVIVLGVDESEFQGMDIRSAFLMAGMDEKSLGMQMKDGLFDDLDDEARAMIATLRKYRYNIVCRFLGIPSGEHMDAVIPYTDFPVNSASAATSKKDTPRSNVPQDIQDMLAIVDEGLREMNEDGITFRKTSIEDNNIVLTADVDENMLFGGISLKTALQLANKTADDMIDSMKQAMFTGDEDSRALIEILTTYRYNIVMRVVGVPSGDTVEGKIRYNEL